MITTQLPVAKKKTKPKRKYQEAWEHLKTSGIIQIKPTLSVEPTVIRKYFRTYTKAIKKEKYLDEQFRLSYPYARLSFKADLEQAMLEVILELNNYNEADF